MLTPPRLVVLSVIMLIVTLASWSKLRFIEQEDHEPQRWLVDEHPALQQKIVPRN